jgi:4-hydroxy-tetrahydrodipicolinate synthase
MNSINASRGDRMNATSKSGARLWGILPALVTPMTIRQEIDTHCLATFTDHLIRQGVHGLVPLGSTGEYYALSPAERELVIRVVVEAAAQRVPVWVGTNAGSTREVVAFSRRAEELGAAGVMLAAPYYSLPTHDELYQHFKAVNDAIGIPILLYNYPGRTGVDMTPDLVEHLLNLDRIQYIKESTGDMARMTTLIRRFAPRLGVFCGCDTLALESFVVGAVGWVGGVVNVLPRAHVRLYELTVQRADKADYAYARAREYFYQMLPVLELIEQSGKYTQLVKAACGLVGHPVGPPRQPLRPATARERARLLEALGRLDEGQPRRRERVRGT